MLLKATTIPGRHVLSDGERKNQTPCAPAIDMSSVAILPVTAQCRIPSWHKASPELVSRIGSQSSSWYMGRACLFTTASNTPCCFSVLSNVTIFTFHSSPGSRTGTAARCPRARRHLSNKNDVVKRINSRKMIRSSNPLTAHRKTQGQRMKTPLSKSINEKEAATVRVSSSFQRSQSLETISVSKISWISSASCLRPVETLTASTSTLTASADV